MSDTLHPAKRDEDRVARLMRRAQDGIYSGLSFASQDYEVAIELSGQHGQAPCGPPDEFGRCSSRYHEPDCSHSVGVDWLAFPEARRGARMTTRCGTGRAG